MTIIKIISVVAALAIAPCACSRADHATPATLLYLDQQGWRQAGREAKATLAADFMRVFCGNPAMPVVDFVNCLDRNEDIGPVFAHAMACLATAAASQSR
jgi:hypothetical protein